MKNIVMTVRDKVASVSQDAYIVCGNDSYILTLDLDDDWEAGSLITARFAFSINGKIHHVDRTTFTNEIKIPVLVGINQVFVGLYTGDETVQTTTPARIRCVPSITCVDSIEIGGDSSKDAEAIAQLKAEVGSLNELKTESKDSIVLAINELYQLIQGLTNTTVNEDVI